MKTNRVIDDPIIELNNYPTDNTFIYPVHKLDLLAGDIFKLTHKSHFEIAVDINRCRYSRFNESLVFLEKLFKLPADLGQEVYPCFFNQKQNERKQGRR